MSDITALRISKQRSSSECPIDIDSKIADQIGFNGIIENYSNNDQGIDLSQKISEGTNNIF